MKTRKRILSALLALILCVSCLLISPSLTALAVTQGDIDELREQSEELNSRISEIEDKLEELSRQEFKTIAQKELYDEQIALLTEQIETTKATIKEYDRLIEIAEENLRLALDAEHVQYDLMCERVRSMEERGTISYLEILFGARSFSDFLGRLDFVTGIIKRDETVMDDYRALQEKTLERRAELDGLRSESQAEKAELESQNAALEKKRKEAEDLIASIQANEAEYEALREELEARDAELADRIAEAEAEYAAQIAAEEARRRAEEEAAAASSGWYYEERIGGGYSAGGVDFIWPAGSYYDITSYFGYRSAESTGYVGSTYHQGIDIGNVFYSTPVVAAASGVVTIAEYSSSAGNYVCISHGNGVSTVYMHMSYLTVSAGETVYQGEQIGVTGSTGNSSGPHLHFGVMIDGYYVDPLDYLP